MKFKLQKLFVLHGVHLIILVYLKTVDLFVKITFFSVRLLSDFEETMSGELDLIWKRPNSKEFPKIWRTFKVKELNSDEFVEYKIQDLPESRFDEAVDFMVEIFCSDEPLSESHGNCFIKLYVVYGYI